jgi:hypothetical protein
LFSGDRNSPGVFSEESYMRIRVPGRFIAVLALLTAFLCLLPASSNVAIARPIGWEDVGPVDPNPRGDNDGVVLKGKSASAPTVVAAGTGNVVAPSSTRYTSLRMFLAVTKLDYWLFWLR